MIHSFSDGLAFSLELENQNPCYLSKKIYTMGIFIAMCCFKKDWQKVIRMVNNELQSNGRNQKSVNSQELTVTETLSMLSSLCFANTQAPRIRNLKEP